MNRRCVVFIGVVLCGLHVASSTILRGTATQGDIAGLTQLYNSTNGAHWTQNTNWLTGDPCGNSWFGVKCRSGNSVTDIDLHNNSLAGTIPKEISKLASLNVIDMQLNVLSGVLPDSFFSISTLSTLVLASNSLSGTIPATIVSAVTLSVLDLSYNKLTGVIPPNFSSIGNITYCIFAGNSLSGSVPANLDTLTGLTLMDLSSNCLSGTMPGWTTTQFPALQSFDVSYNLNLNCSNVQLPSSVFHCDGNTNPTPGGHC